jgi:hypothetical protein
MIHGSVNAIHMLIRHYYIQFLNKKEESLAMKYYTNKILSIVNNEMELVNINDVKQYSSYVFLLFFLN